jgi:predicted acylesterase/phospholipase RssA
MYLKKNGREIQTLVLSGGGTSAFSMYMGLLKDIDLDALTFDLVLCSASALWFADVLCRKLQTDTESDERITRLKNIHKDLVNVDLVSLLESEHETVFGAKQIDTMREIYSCLDNIRIKDLKKLCNERLIRFAVSEMNEDILCEPIIIDETNSEDTFVFDVILASCSLPLIFPSVSLTVNGQVRQCLDGDMSDYPKLLDCDNYTVVRPRVFAAKNLYNNFKTKIPIIDNLLKFVTSVVIRALYKTWTGHMVFHDCVANIDTPMWDEDLYKTGVQVFEDNFTFEKTD